MKFSLVYITWAARVPAYGKEKDPQEKYVDFMKAGLSAQLYTIGDREGLFAMP